MLWVFLHYILWYYILYSTHTCNQYIIVLGCTTFPAGNGIVVHVDSSSRRVSDTHRYHHQTKERLSCGRNLALYLVGRINEEPNNCKPRSLGFSTVGNHVRFLETNGRFISQAWEVGTHSAEVGYCRYIQHHPAVPTFPVVFFFNKKIYLSIFNTFCHIF